MKDKTKLTKEYLSHALRSLPGDRMFEDVRLHLRRALQEIEHVEKKGQRRAKQQQEPTIAEKWKMDLQRGTLVNPYSPTNALKLIEQMISGEQNKLEQIKKSQEEAAKGDENVQDVGTILG